MQKETSKDKTKNTYEPLLVEVFNCIFSEEVSPFGMGQQEEYENHLGSVHKVFFENKIISLLNFMNDEKKRNIIEQAKKNCKERGFVCVLFMSRQTQFCCWAVQRVLRPFSFCSSNLV